MQEQAGKLMNAVSMFKLQAAKKAARTAQAVATPAVPRRVQAPPRKERKLIRNSQEADDDWKEF